MIHIGKTICYYHANCFDGMAAAWVVKRRFPKAVLVAAQYDNKDLETSIMQDCYENANINDHYVIVDFSFPRDLMKLMAYKALSIIVLDHHKTAQANCEGLDFCKFDMEQSGAGLAWRYYYPSEPVPELVRYIEDRDLWRFELDNSDLVNAYIQSWPIEIETYAKLAESLNTAEGMQRALIGGQSVVRYKKSMVESICRNAVVRDVGGHQVPTVNAGILFSEVGHKLCQMYPEYPFAASFFIRQDGKIVYSLRSIGSFDVSEVAKSQGGSGHANAAGFERGLVAMI